MGISLVSNSVGCGTAVVLAVGSTATGYGMGKVSKSIYSAKFNQMDVVNGVGVDKLCR